MTIPRTLFRSLHRFAPRPVRRVMLDRRIRLLGDYSLEATYSSGCLFVHIPKCAGVSTCRALFGNLGPGHLTLRQQTAVLSANELRRLFKFTFVRNPWDRLVSAYYFLKQGGMNRRDRQWSDRHLAVHDSFERFVLDWLTPVNATRWVHFRPQVSFLDCDDHGFGMDFVGRVESFDHDMDYVQSRLGREVTTKTINTSSSRSVDYQSEYSRATCQRVHDVYGDDIERLGYRFD